MTLEAEVRRWARRIGAHDAGEGAIRGLLARITALRHRLALEGAYVKSIQDELVRRRAQPKPPLPGDDGSQPTPFWKYLLGALFLALSAFFVLRLLRKPSNP